MIRNSDIIMFCLSRWDAPISSPAFSLAKEFSRNNRVFYIDHPFSIKDFLQKLETPQVKVRKDALLWGRNMYTKPQGLSENLTIVTPKLTLPINFLSDGFLYQKLSKQNDRVVFDAIRNIIRDYDIKDFIYFNAFNPFFCREFPADIKPIKKIYQSMDDMTQAEYTARHGARLEEEIIQKFDITLTTSKELRRLKSRFSDQVYYHPNAADFSVFEKALTEDFPMPAELLAANGRKIIGFTGNIEGRTDYQLLKKILDYHTDKVLAMVGPVTTDEHKTIGLADHPNVIMVGPKKITELPQYLQYFDCALIPFKKNLLTKSIYPLKINEYLAAGRPVVATDFSEDIKEFREVAYIGGNHDEFVSLIDKAIYENDDEKIAMRRQVANENTWAARVEAFWQILEGNTVHAEKVASARAA
jgi:teichuronic acid biosynthesis glycosyltransferase TuaH